MKKFVMCSFVWVVVACMGLITSGYCEEMAPVVLLHGTLIDGTGVDPVPNAVIVIEQD